MLSANSILFVSSSLSGAAIVGVLWWKDVIRPTSLDKTRDVSGVPTPVWLLCAAMVFLAQMEGGLLVSQLKDSAIGPARSLRHDAIVQLASYGVGVAVAALMVFLLRPRAGEKAGLAVGWRDVPHGALAMLLAAPLCICVAMVCQLFASKEDTVAHEGLRRIIENRDSPWGAALALCAVLGAPIVEEVVYRGCLQSALLGTLRSGWGAIIGTSTIFAAMHFVGGGPVPLHALPPLFVLSVSMGVAYEHTKRLGVPITMHVLFNLANVIVGVATHPR